MMMVEMNEGDKIIRAKSLEYLNSTQEWKMEHFYKGHTLEIRKVMKELSTKEKAFLFSIATYIGYEDCCLKYDNGEIISTDDLVEISGMGRSTVFEVIASLMKNDIIYKGRNSKNRQYFINPWLFCKGNRINKVLRTMFRNYRVRVMGNCQWKNIKG